MKEAPVVRSRQQLNQSLKVILAIAAIALAVNGGLGIFLALPGWQAVRDSNEQLAAAQANREHQLQNQQQDEQVLEEEIRSLLAKVPVSIAPSSVLQAIGPLAAGAGVRLDMISQRGSGTGEAGNAASAASAPSAPSAFADVQAVGFEVSISGGSLGETLQFIARLQQAVRLMHIKEWRYYQQGVSNEGAPIYGATLTIDAYAMPQYSDQLQLDLPEIKEREAAVQALMDRVAGLEVDE